MAHQEFLISGTVEALQKEKASLLRRVQELEERLGAGLEGLDSRTFHSLTGFASWQSAKTEFHLISAEIESSVSRHSVVHQREDLFDKAAEDIGFNLPGLGDALTEVVEEMRKELFLRDAPKRQHTAGEKVDDFHVFLIPFLTLRNGAGQYFAPVLPGIRCTQQHYSRLLRNCAPVVAKHWAPHYYKIRDLAWVKEHCTSPCGHYIDLFLDGTEPPTRKHGAYIEEHMMYSGKKKQHTLLIGVLSNRREEIVEISPAMAPRMSENFIARHLQTLSALDDEIQRTEGSPIAVRLFLDRGYYFFNQNPPTFGHIQLQIELPHHLNAPQRQVAKRKHFDAEEVVQNIWVAANRWVNEKTVGRFNHGKFWKHTMELSMLPLIEDMKTIQAALVNYHIQQLAKKKALQKN